MFHVKHYHCRYFTPYIYTCQILTPPRTDFSQTFWFLEENSEGRQQKPYEFLLKVVNDQTSCAMITAANTITHPMSSCIDSI